MADTAGAPTRPPGRLWRRSLVVLAALMVCAGCANDPGAGRTDAGSIVLDGSVGGFESFSGMELPDAATDIEVTVTTGTTNEPDYFAAFDLPTSDVDAFCRDGQMSRPLHVVTISASLRETFDYDGDSSSGVRVGQASLPSNVRIQREVFATGTLGPVAHVVVHAYAIGR